MAPVCQSNRSRAILRNRWNRKQNLVGHSVQSTESHTSLEPFWELMMLDYNIIYIHCCLYSVS